MTDWIGYTVIYDGNCNLCSNLVRLLETLDQGARFRYVSMHEEAKLQELGLSLEDCQQGMILLDSGSPPRRWQGSDAAEEIGRLLPLGEVFVQTYRALPGLKAVGDRVYLHVRDNRYALFGKREAPYESAYPLCDSGTCHTLDC